MRRARILTCGTIIAILIGLVVALGVGIHKARDAAIACTSQGRLNQMQCALFNYHQAYGCFPPAFIADAKGKPKHSWRVLILPFIDSQDLYALYNFDEPWNGPNNSKLSNRMPETFHVHSEPASTSVTNLVVIVGPDTAFPGSKSTRFEDFTDGTDNTILLAENAHSDINWLEPRDLRVEEMSFVPDDRSKPSISTSRHSGPYVAFADSICAHRISPLLSPESLKSLTTIAGGEKMYIAKIDGLGLTSPTPGPTTDEKVKQLDQGGLHALWLSRSDVTDEAIQYLASVPSLTELHLRGTRISDEGLKYFQQKSSLEILDLSQTEISNHGVNNLKEWWAGQSEASRYNHVIINLNGTRVTMSGVAQFLKSLPETQFLSHACIYIKGCSVSQELMTFDNSDISDADIACFQGLSTLRHVYLNQTQITDDCLRTVASFKNLEHLNLSGTRISDEGLEHLKGLIKLQSLDLDGTTVTGEGVKKLQQSLPECKIEWKPPAKDR